MILRLDQSSSLYALKHDIVEYGKELRKMTRTKIFEEFKDLNNANYYTLTHKLSQLDKFVTENFNLV